MIWIVEISWSATGIVSPNRPGPAPQPRRETGPCSLAAFHTSAVTGRWRLWPRRATSPAVFPPVSTGFRCPSRRTGSGKSMNLYESYIETYGNIWKHMETYGNIWKPSGWKPSGIIMKHMETNQKTLESGKPMAPLAPRHEPSAWWELHVRWTTAHLRHLQRATEHSLRNHLFPT